MYCNYSHMCKEDYRKATTYFDKKNRKYEQPRWHKTNNCGLEFTPSTNIAPTEVTPVLVSGDHYKNEAERVLQPMMWGMIPRWHRVGVSTCLIIVCFCIIYYQFTLRLCS